MIKFIIGFLLGGLAGIYTICLCIIAKENKMYKEMEEEDDGYEKID